MSRSPSRQRRVPPARKGPVRNPLSHSPKSPDGPEGPKPGGASQSGADYAGPLFGALENGVRTAYQVIDEYMRRGYEAASGSNPYDPNTRGPMHDKNPNYGHQHNPFTILTEQWMMVMRTWVDIWSSFIPRGWPPPQDPWNSYSAAPPTTTAAPIAVSVRVNPDRHATVSVRLNPGADMLELVADPLHARLAPEPHIDPSSITFTTQPGSVSVAVDIPEEVPSGPYAGNIRSTADNTIVGLLTVTIDAQAV